MRLLSSHVGLSPRQTLNPFLGDLRPLAEAAAPSLLMLMPLVLRYLQTEEHLTPHVVPESQELTG